jgi:hypothetical protein
MERGDKGKQVMELVAQLEGKVREKNLAIEELKEDLLRKDYMLCIAPIVAKPIAFGMGFVGGLVNMGIIWYVVHRWF